MANEIPNHLLNDNNCKVLNYVQGKSAHSDTYELWWKSLKEYGHMEFFCSDPSSFGCVIAYVGNLVIGYVVGMQSIAYRIPETEVNRALSHGGRKVPGLEPGWVEFPVYQAGMPEPEVDIWAALAYKNALLNILDDK